MTVVGVRPLVSRLNLLHAVERSTAPREIDNVPAMCGGTDPKAQRNVGYILPQLLLQRVRDALLSRHIRRFQPGRTQRLQPRTGRPSIETGPAIAADRYVGCWI